MGGAYSSLHRRLSATVQPSHPVIQPSPYDSFLLTIYLKRVVRSAFEFLYKGIVMPIIVILFHRCEFFCKITAFSVGCQCGIAETDTDIEAMKLLYDNPDELIEVDSIQESTQEIANITQENLNSTQEITNDTQEIKSNRERLISLLHGNPNLTLAEIAEIIGLTRDGVKKIADKLLAEGILSHEGSTKAGKWIVKLED